MKSHHWSLLLAIVLLVGSAPGYLPSAQAQVGEGQPAAKIQPEALQRGGQQFVSPIDDFGGMVAVAYMTGTGSADNDPDLEIEAHLRLMQGIFRDRAGSLQRGTFLLATVDVFRKTATSRTRIHSLYLGPSRKMWSDPNAPLRWTTMIPHTVVGGSAFAPLLQINFEQLEFNDAFNGERTEERPAKAMNFYASWEPLLNFHHFRSEREKFSGMYCASIAYTDFSFTSQKSAVDATSFNFKSTEGVVKTVFAKVGYEENGMFLEGP